MLRKRPGAGGQGDERSPKKQNSRKGPEDFPCPFATRQAADNPVGAGSKGCCGTSTKPYRDIAKLKCVAILTHIFFRNTANLSSRSEHIKRVHSLEYTCRFCMHSYGVVSSETLKVLKKEHEPICTRGAPSQCGARSRKASDPVRMTEQQHEAWKGWSRHKLEPIDGELPAEESWRKIYRCIFKEDRTHPSMRRDEVAMERPAPIASQDEVEENVSLVGDPIEIQVSDTTGNPLGHLTSWNSTTQFQPPTQEGYSDAPSNDPNLDVDVGPSRWDSNLELFSCPSICDSTGAGSSSSRLQPYSSWAQTASYSWSMHSGNTSSIGYPDTTPNGGIFDQLSPYTAPPFYPPSHASTGGGMPDLGGMGPSANTATVPQDLDLCSRDSQYPYQSQDDTLRGVGGGGGRGDGNDFMNSALTGNIPDEEEAEDQGFGLGNS